MAAKLQYRRNLPHWHPKGAALFITWRLHGSLPRHVLQAIEAKKHLSPGRKFTLADSELDRAAFGPAWLKDARLAGAVVDSLRHGGDGLGHYELHAFVVMVNHVHVLLTPKVDVARLLRGIKRHTATVANALLGRAGQRFWQEESFDHWCRHPEEFARIQHYIEWNPVKAGLVKRPDAWPWSSASR